MYSQKLIRFHFIFHVVILAIPASMEVNRGQNGIQQLLAAEQEAQQIVNAARNGNWNFLLSVFWELLYYVLAITCTVFFAILLGKQE